MSRLDKLENLGIKKAIRDAVEEKQSIEEPRLRSGRKKSSQEERRREDEDRVNDLFREILPVEDLAFKERPVRLGRYDTDKSALLNYS